jgi:hypothetical protein
VTRQYQGQVQAHEGRCGVTKCITCGNGFDRDGGPMIAVCTPCLFAENAKRPPDYIQRNGLLVPNEQAPKPAR